MFVLLYMYEVVLNSHKEHGCGYTTARHNEATPVFAVSISLDPQNMKTKKIAEQFIEGKNSKGLFSQLLAFFFPIHVTYCSKNAY